MPLTTPKGYRFPTSGQTPDVPRDIRNLAEDVNDANAATDIVVADLAQRVAALEAGTSMVGWTPIQEVTVSGISEFDIDLTDGGRFSVAEFALIRLHMRYELGAVGSVNVRINNDDGGGSAYRFHMRGTDGFNPDGDITGPFPITPAQLGVDVLDSQSAGSWVIGHGATVSTNNLTCTLFHMDGNLFHSFQSTSNRQSASATTAAWVQAWGALESSLSAAPSTLRIFVSLGGTEFTDARTWAEGYRLPA